MIGITDRRTSPLAACSNDILLVPIQSPSFFQSYVATTALIEILLGMVMAHGGPSVVENIDRLERCRRGLDVYWQERVRPTADSSRYRSLIPGQAGHSSSAKPVTFAVRRIAVEGRLARFVYVSLDRMHLIAIHGWLRGVLLIAIGRVNQVVRPRLELH